MIYADFGALVILCWSSDEKSPPLRDEESCLRVRRGRIVPDPRVMVSVILLKHFEKCLSGEHVDAFSRGVVEQIIAAACDFRGGCLFACLRIEHQQLRRLPASYEQTMMSFIERHWEIASCGGDGPSY